MSSISDESKTSLKKHKQKKARKQSELFNIITYETEPISDEWFLIKKTRRKSLYIHIPTYQCIVQMALFEKKYQITGYQLYVNPNGIVNEHSNIPHNLRIVIEINASSGPNKKDISRPIRVDILSIHRRGSKIPIAYEDPKNMVMIEKIINIFKKTHWPCITNTCYVTFDKKLVYGGIPVTCPECKETQCVSCGTAWAIHGDSCDVYKAKLVTESINDSKIISELLSGEMQFCPKCSVIIKRESGCNKMVCQNIDCKTYWCWACGKADLNILYHDPYDHYSCESNKYKGINGQQTNCPFGTMLRTMNDDITNDIVNRNLKKFPDIKERLLKVQEEEKEQQAKEQQAKK